MNSSNSSSKRPAIILLADDNPADQVTVSRALEDSHINCHLQIVEDGLNALNFLNREAPFDNASQFPLPDLILLDINMPLLDGLGTLRKIREQHTLRNLPVVMLTTSDNPDDIKNCYIAGAAGYITKPVNQNDFIKTLPRLNNFWYQLIAAPE